MSCDMPVQKGVKNAATDCRCHGAVMRAYSGMIAAGRPQCTALEAAVLVYGYHHPEDSKADQVLTVERWVNEGHLQ